MSAVNAWATCSVGSLHGTQGSVFLQRRATGTSPGRWGDAVFFATRGTHIIVPTVTVAGGARSPGAHPNKSSGRGPPGSRFSVPSGAE